MATKRQCQRALEFHQERLEKYSNVVGLGVVRLDEAGSHEIDSTDAVAVYVDRKLPEGELPAEQVIPNHLEIEGRDGTLQVPIKVIEAGQLSRQSLDSD